MGNRAFLNRGVRKRRRADDAHLAAGSDIRLTRGTTDVFVISLKQSKMLVTSQG
jgi:hypothetical protein